MFLDHEQDDHPPTPSHYATELRASRASSSTEDETPYWRRPGKDGTYKESLEWQVEREALILGHQERIARELAALGIAPQIDFEGNRVVKQEVFRKLWNDLPEKSIKAIVEVYLAETGIELGPNALRAFFIACKIKAPTGIWSYYCEHRRHRVTAYRLRRAGGDRPLACRA
jgi:hypothetical protein